MVFRRETLFHPSLSVNFRSVEMMLAFVGYEELVSAVFLRARDERIGSACPWIDRVNLASVVLKEDTRIIRSFSLEEVHEIPTLI